MKCASCQRTGREKQEDKARACSPDFAVCWLFITAQGTSASIPEGKGVRKDVSICKVRTSCHTQNARNKLEGAWELDKEARAQHRALSGKFAHLVVAQLPSLY